MPAPTQPRILIVEDEPAIADTLLYALGTEGFATEHCLLGRDGLAALRRGGFALAILDVGLPDMNGFDLCRELRRETDLPVIFLTARGEEIDRIVGLEIGADDYLPKPFNPRELLARIRAVLRRRTPVLPGAPGGEGEPVHFGPNHFDPRTRELTHAGERRPLTSGEFAVLRALVSHPRVPLAREKLMALARGREPGAGERSIDVHISRIRKLVETDPLQPRYVQTVWGVGYCFVPDSDQAGDQPGEAAGGGA